MCVCVCVCVCVFVCVFVWCIVYAVMIDLYDAIGIVGSKGVAASSGTSTPSKL